MTNKVSTLFKALKKNILLLIFFVFVTVANLYIFFNKDSFAYVNQVSYLDLYPSPDGGVLFDRINDSSLLVKPFSSLQESGNWSLAIDDSTVPYTFPKPQILFKPGTHTYTLNNNKNQKIISRILFEPKNTRMDQQDFWAILSVQVIPGYNVNSDKIINILSSNYRSPDSKEAAEINSILRDSMHISAYLNSSEKIKRIGIYLHQTIFKSQGVPTPETITLNSFQQYKAATKGIKIQCGQYAAIFNLFANAANLKCREVGLSGPVHNFTGAAHTLNEYFNTEQNKWAVVDIMNNFIACYTNTGELMNIVQLKNASFKDSTISIIQAVGDSMIAKKYSEFSNEIYDNYSIQNNVIIRDTRIPEDDGVTWRRFTQYFSPSKKYIIYSDTRVNDNSAFTIKQIAFWLWVFAFLVFAGSMMIYFLKKK